MKRVLTSAAAVVLVAMALPSAADACAVCYGDPDSTMSQGMNNGILALLGVVGFVQLGLVAMFAAIWTRTRRLRRQRDRFEVLQGGIQ